MRRHGLGREQRGAHRAEPPGGGPLATVGHVLGSTVPKRVSPPRPLRVVVFSGVIVGALLFSYSTTQIYLRFAEPSQDPPVPGVTASAAPAPDTGDGTGTQAAASTQVEITVEGEDEEEPSPPQGQRDEADGAAAAPGRQEGAPSPPPPPVSVPQSATGTPQVSYQKVVYDENHFMGQLTITNTGSGVLEGWELQVGFSDAQVVSAWGSEWESVPGGFVARQPSWAGGIPPGQSTTVSFTARGRSHTPESCSLNGASCSL